MIQFTRKLCVAALLSTAAFSCLALGAPAFAADAPQGDGASSTTASDAGEVIVTAQKRAERLRDVPMSVTAISGSRLTATQATTLQDVVNSVPGIQLVSASPVTDELVIRGLSVGGGINSSVATYVDEVPYTSEGPFAYSASIAPNFDTYDLARVEVLRGPQGTLYGANALAGLLKYVTNAPDPSHFSASVLAGGSTVDHGGDGYEVHGMINVPLGDNAALRIVANDSLFPGFIDDPSRGKTDINDIQRYGGRASFLWQATPDLSLRLSANYQNLSAGDFSSEDLEPVTLKPLFGDLIQEREIAQPLQVTNEIYNATINWNLGFASLLSSTSFSEASPVLTEDDSAVYGPILGAIFGGAFGAAVKVTEPVDTFTQELRLSSPTGHNLEWMVGGYFTDEWADEHESVLPVDLVTHQIAPSLLPNLGAFHITSTYREYAAFADLTYHFTPAFEVSIGGRESTNSQTYHQVNAGLLTGTNNFSTSSDQSVFTYSVDAKYRFSPEAMAYARVASGFVPGGPNDVIPGSTLPSTFRSSTLTSYEIGIKGTAADGRISYDLDGFYVAWQDIQLEAVIANLSTITNGGAARSQGLEGAVSYTPMLGLTLSFDGAYTDARLSENTPTSFGGKAGDRLPLSPYFSGTLSAEYDRPLWSDWSGFAGVDWHYDGERMSDFEFGIPRESLPGYSMVDLRAGVRFRNYTITAYVKNAGDARGISNVAPEALTATAPLSASIVTPRTIGATLAAHF
ncbi:MAG TPA: TonB-dependent receptor [Caulobacteraceae bacterium]|jgi:outer membrane receptor protein involved in Fe transport|nr:TonB-dependent receptor [Caulobacteraceae bacterium]